MFLVPIAIYCIQGIDDGIDLFFLNFGYFFAPQLLVLVIGLFLRQHFRTMLRAWLLTNTVLISMACLLWIPRDQNPENAMVWLIYWPIQGLALLVYYGFQIKRYWRSKKSKPNQASDSTSEPAPGADSSAHQG